MRCRALAEKWNNNLASKKLKRVQFKKWSHLWTFLIYTRETNQTTISNTISKKQISHWKEKKNEVRNCGRNKSFLKKDTKTNCAHLLFKVMQLRCKALSVIPHLGFGNIAKFGKSKSDYYFAFPTPMKGHGVGSSKQVGLFTLCSQFTDYYANSLCSKNLTIMLKKFH